LNDLSQIQLGILLELSVSMASGKPQTINAGSRHRVAGQVVAVVLMLVGIFLQQGNLGPINASLIELFCTWSPLILAGLGTLQIVEYLPFPTGLAPPTGRFVVILRYGSRMRCTVRSTTAN